MGDPIAGSLVVFDLVPIMVFEVEFDGKVRAFEKDEVSDVVTDLQPGGVCHGSYYVKQSVHVTWSSYLL